MSTITLRNLPSAYGLSNIPKNQQSIYLKYYKGTAYGLIEAPKYAIVFEIGTWEDWEFDGCIGFNSYTILRKALGKIEGKQIKVTPQGIDFTGEGDVTMSVSSEGRKSQLTIEEIADQGICSMTAPSLHIPIEVLTVAKSFIPQVKGIIAIQQRTDSEYPIAIRGATGGIILLKKECINDLKD